MLKWSLLCDSVCSSGLMAEVDYVILDEWYRWTVDNHPCHVDQIGLYSVSVLHHNMSAIKYRRVDFS